MRQLYVVITILGCFLSLKAAESDLTVRNEKASINLAGTLSLPEDASPKALLLLVTGSGPQNRDEEVMGLKPFKVLADALVKNGYGVLRMDDRGVGSSEGDYENAVLEDFTDDAEAAVNYLRKSFPDKKIGILGHSQGGHIAVKAANRGVADFIVTLAVPAWPGDSVVMSQARAMAVAMTGNWPGEALERQLLDIAMMELPPFAATPLLANTMLTPLGEQASVPQVRDYVYKQVEPMTSPGYRDLLRYDPKEDISKVNVPWLAFNGDKDLQVLPENLKTVRELNNKVWTIVVPGHNHLFQKAVTGLPDEYVKLGQSPTNLMTTVMIENLERLLAK